MTRLLLLIALFVGCSGILDPAERDWQAYGARRIVPTEWHRSVHGTVEECVGVRRSFDVIEWFTADSIIWYGQPEVQLVGRSPEAGVFAAGLWISPNRLYFMGKQYESPYVVSHELIHYLLQDPTHDDVAFEKCVLLSHES